MHQTGKIQSMKEQDENIGEVFTQPQSGQRFLNIHQSQKLQKKRMINLKGLKNKKTSKS